MDKLSWKWQKGAPTTIAEFGTPTAGDDYALCIFNDSAAPSQLLLSARAPAGSNWQPTGTGFRYSGGSSRVPDGLSSLTLKTGSTGNAKLSVKGVGDLLPLPAAATPWSLPLLVQLQSDAGTCWEARFSTAAKNDGVQFKAKSD